MFKNNIKQWFGLLKQIFIGLLSFSGSLATKCTSLNHEPCMARLFLIGFNLAELKHYPFMISLDKCSGICNSGSDLSTKISFPNKAKM